MAPIGAPILTWACFPFRFRSEIAISHRPSGPAPLHRRCVMNDQDVSIDWAVQKFGIGQPVPRTEDPKLVRGQGSYTDVSAARGMPGVLGAFTGQDLASAGYGTLKCIVAFKNRDGSEMRKPPRPALPTDKVRFVGDPLAFVVAETAVQAREAAEAVAVEIEPLPAVTRASEAAKPGAPALYQEAPDNVALDYHYGDANKVAEAFARATHVVRLGFVNNRVVVNAMEPRAAVAAYDAKSESFILHVGCQGAFGMRGQLAGILNVPPEKIRVLTGSVGGSFGMKAAAYPEYVCVLHAARGLGRAVKWTADRFESFVSDHHGRDHECRGELALDDKGRFLALRFSGYGNMGAYLGTVAPLMSTLNLVKNSVSVYRVPLLEVSTQCMFTNTTLVSAYRGAGRPEANYYMERLIDLAAAETGIDRIAIRRRNHVKAGEIPYAAASGMTYDSGDFAAVLDDAVALADWKGFAKRKRESRKRGRLRGRGIRFEPDGTVTLITGTLDYGQGHAAPFAQVLGERLGIPFDRIRLIQGDSDELVFGGGTGGSRSITATGTAIVEASDEVIERGRKIAGFVLEAAETDIEFAAGRFVIAGTDRSIGILELAQQIRDGLKLPQGLPQSLDVKQTTKDVIPSTFPNGCHVAEVEIDPETGVIEVVKYAAVNDFGTIVNPMLVEGQMHGGIVQGIGQALIERTVYDAEGQLLSGSYMDYALPRASDVPFFTTGSHPVPAKSNPLGTKGCGEAGCAGALTSVMNAVADALSEYGIEHVDMPLTPDRVWQAIEAAKGEQNG